MAGTATIASGHDPRYYTSQAGRGADYYSGAAGKSGMEPEGTWQGAGCSDLGLTAGGTVDPEVFLPLFTNLTDPRDGSRLGRAMSRYASWHDAYIAACKAEPEATKDRQAELRDEAKAQARQAVQYFDVTFSPSKDITLLHASFMASMVAAQDSGDDAAAAYWQQAADDVWSCVSAGSRAMLDYLQDHAGYTRSDYHRGRAGDGSGRWEDAHGWIGAAWRQHTSRAGDPQLHIHNTILNRVKRERDGAWRTIDGRAIYRERGAAAAQGTLAMETALTHKLGVEWVLRDDGRGRQIKGVSERLMDEFSKRTRQEIAGELARLVDEYKAQNGYDPDSHALYSLRQKASKVSRAPKTSSEPGDLRLHVRQWAQEARRADGEALEPLGALVSNRKGPGAAAPEPAPVSAAPPMTALEECRLMEGALARVQSAESAWTRSALHRALGELLPASTRAEDEDGAAALIPALAGRVLAGEVGRVVMLAAPQWPAVPDALRRASGESMFAPHAAERYATEAQLTMEERVIARASARGAGVPRLAPALGAELLGAAQAQLEAQLSCDAEADVTTGTGSGLHLDQAAAAWKILTSDRRAEVMVGPAGTGKTRTMGVVSRAWLRANPDARVIGLTTSQHAALVLSEVGITSHNIAMFLTDSRLRRDIPPGSLIILDEASMTSMQHLYEVLRIAARAGAKVAVTGDPYQLGAVQQAGAMEMLARWLGWVQLAEPMRFREEWQRGASLRLRAGEVTVLGEYDRHGRFRYGTREEMTEAAYRAWLTDYLAGRHSVLLANDQADADELSRRARADLIRYGRVSASGGVRLRDEATASAGDLIMARQNDHKQGTGIPDRYLANRDVLQVTRTDAGNNGRAVEVRLALGRGEDGAERWGPRFLLRRSYLAEECHLAYGRTIASAEGSTFEHNSYSLIRSSDTRKALYTAATRGREQNIVYAVAEAAGNQYSAPQADPEVARSRALALERAGLPAPDTAPLDGDAVSVLAQVIQRDDEDLAASETLARALSDADHLADIGHRWVSLVKDEQRERHGRALRQALPDHLAEEALDDAAVTWLFRELRAAELAGRDGCEVLAEAVAMRPLTGIRDPARVLQGRVRSLTRGLQPQVGTSWLERVPRTASPDMHRYLSELAAAIDARVQRLGEFAAITAPVWAVRALGPVPQDRAEREDWQQRAAVVASYREMHGYENPGDPIGPEPSRRSPEARADWHDALAVLGRVDGMDLAGVPDEVLETRARLYEKETAWAPEDVAEPLRLARMTVAEAKQRSDRSRLEALAASGEARSQHEANKAIWDAMKARAYEQMTAYEKADASRREWDRVTEATRRVSLGSNVELQRRYPEREREQLRSAEPASTLERVQAVAEPAQQALPGLEPAREPEVLTERQEEQRTLAALGLTRETIGSPDPGHAQQAAERAREAEERLAEIRSLPEPEEDPDIAPSEAWAAAVGRRRGAVLQPAERLIEPAPQLQADREAAE